MDSRSWGWWWLKDEENRGDFTAWELTREEAGLAFREFSRTVGGSLFAGRLNYSTLGLCNILVDHSLEGDARLTIIHPTGKVGS